MASRIDSRTVGHRPLFMERPLWLARSPQTRARVFLANHVLGHVRSALWLGRIVLVGVFHESSLAYIGGMHPLEQHYAGGSDYALAAFGLEKIAIMSAEQRAAFMKAREGRPQGLDAVRGASGDAALAQMKPSAASPQRQPLSLGAAPTAPMQMEQGFGGGPGMAAGFGGGSLPLETSPGYGEASLKGQQPSRKLPTAMTGAGSIPGQAAQAEIRARAVPMKYNLPNKLASFLLPTA